MAKFPTTEPSKLEGPLNEAFLKRLKKQLKKRLLINKKKNDKIKKEQSSLKLSQNHLDDETSTSSTRSSTSVQRPPKGGKGYLQSLTQELAEFSNHTESFSMLEGEDDDDDDTGLTGSSVAQTVNLDSSWFSFCRYVTDTFDNQNLAWARMTGQLRDATVRTLNHDYTEILLQQAPTNTASVQDHLVAAHHIVEEYDALRSIFLIRYDKRRTQRSEEGRIDENDDPRNSIQATVPASLMSLFELVLQDFLRPRIALLYDATGSSMTHDQRLTVTPGDAAQILVWIDRLQTHARTHWSRPEQEHDAMLAWKRDAKVLLNHYIEHGVQTVLRQHLQNTVKLAQKGSQEQDEEDRQEQVFVRRNANGHVVTDHPEQVLHILHLQMEVAEASLPKSDDWAAIWRACLIEVQDMIIDQVAYWQTNWKTSAASTQRFCAVINDAARLADMIENLNQTYFAVEESDGEDSDPDSINLQVSLGLSELSLLACRQLVDRILETYLANPTDPVLTRVGTRAWATSSSSVMDRAAEVLASVIEDTRHWLQSPYYYVPKLIKHGFNAILQMYVESFFGSTLRAPRATTTSTSGFDASAAATCLRRDADALESYFVHDPIVSEYHGVAGMYTATTMQSRLGLLRSMANLIDPSIKLPDEKRANNETSQSSSLVKDATYVQQQCDAGPTAVLHLIGLRSSSLALESLLGSATLGLSSPSSPVAAWLRIVARAEQSVVVAEQEHPHLPYRLPDLRNSPQLRKLQALHPQKVSQLIAPRRLEAAATPTHKKMGMSSPLQAAATTTQYAANALNVLLNRSTVAPSTSVGILSRPPLAQASPGRSSNPNEVVRFDSLVGDSGAVLASSVSPTGAANKPFEYGESARHKMSQYAIRTRISKPSSPTGSAMA